MKDKNNPLHRDTLAVREAVERSPYGENSEALFLSTAFVQPDSETSARRFANNEDFTYGRTSNPTVRSLARHLDGAGDEAPSALAHSAMARARRRRR